MAERGEHPKPESPSQYDSLPDDNIVELDKHVNELYIKDKGEHYSVERTCPDCKKDFKASVLKQFYSKREARQFFDDNPVCGACINADKIQAAADRMNLMRDDPADNKEAS